MEGYPQFTSDFLYGSGQQDRMRCSIPDGNNILHYDGSNGDSFPLTLMSLEYRRASETTSSSPVTASSIRRQHAADRSTTRPGRPKWRAPPAPPGNETVKSDPDHTHSARDFCHPNRLKHWCHRCRIKRKTRELILAVLSAMTFLMAFSQEINIKRCLQELQ